MTGRILSRGKIRVDARRALGKLREHLLVDLDLYLTEIVRAAALAGAREVVLDWDANDVIVGFEGAPPRPESLERLLDHLTGDGGERRLRLLALGVNAALGTRPERVDVWALDGERSERVRFDPVLLEREGSRPERASAAPPPGWPAAGVAVHVRKRLGWTVVRRAVVAGVHREVELLRERLGERSIAVLAAGQALEPSGRARPLVQRPIEVFGATHAAVELLAQPSAPVVEHSELGVVLARTSWQPPLGFSSISARVVLDAVELPTNASRSAVREDSRLLEDLAGGAEGALFEAVRALAAIVRGEPPPAGTEVADVPHALFEQTLGEIVTAVAAEERAGREICPEARALYDLPLLSDAAGRPRSVASFSFQPKIWALRGDEPPPAELAPWLGSVLWLRGRSAERALDSERFADAAELVELARAGAERRRRLLAHPETDPCVPRSELEIARARFDREGVSGEVAVLTPDAKGTLVRVFVERRHFASFELSRAAVPLPMDIAVASNDLQPSFAWDGIASEGALRRAISVGLGAGISASLSLAGRLQSLDKRERAALALIFRAAIGVLGHVTDGERSRRALDELAIWPTTAGRFASLGEIARFAARCRAVCFADSRAGPGVAADGRPVVVATREELGWLAAALGGEVELVPYSRGLRPVASLGAPEQERALRAAFDAEQARLQPDGARPAPLELALGGARVLAAIAPASRVVEVHAGSVLGTTPRPALLGDLLLAIDDPRTVPNAAWSTPRYRPPRHFWKLERALLEHVLQAAAPFPPAVRVYLLQAVGRLAARMHLSSGKDAEQRRELLARLRELPLVPVLETGGALAHVTLAALEAIHPKEALLPVLEQPVDFETFDWRPVVLASEAERDALRALYPELGAATVELAARRQRAEEHASEVAFRALPELDPRQPEGADPAWPTAVVEAPAPFVESVVAALPRAGVAGAVEVLWTRRKLPSSERFAGPPIAARVSIAQAGAPTSHRSVAEWALAGIEIALERAGRALLDALVEDASENVRSAELLADPRLHALAAHYTPAASSEIRALLERLAWPAVQGGEVQGRALVSEGNRIRFARQRPAVWLARAEGRSDLDEPVLHLPQGSPLEPLVVRLGYALADVTAAVDKLQARRAKAENSPAPRLGGDPPHPELRFSLAALEVRRAEGEVELIHGPACEVTLVDLEGASHAIDATVPIPFRLLARSEMVGRDQRAIKALLRETASALAREISKLSVRFDALPPFVRAHARRLVVTRVESGALLPAAYAQMPVFEDTRGTHRSLADLRARSEWRFTDLPPPYPERVYEPAILVLSREEAKALSQVAKLRRASSMVQRDLGAERRRSASPVDEIALSAEWRSRCLVTAAIAVSSTEGEVGVLLPSAAAERGVELHVGRRRLGRIADGDGWPLLAVVNDDSVKPNRWFDAPQRKTERAQILTRARQAADGALAERWLARAGLNRLERVDGELRVSGARLEVAGALWLTDDRSRPSVIVHLPSTGTPLEGALAVPGVHACVSGALPLAGEVMVAVKSGALPRVDVLLAGLGKRAVSIAVALCGDDAQREVERWMLALAGVPLALSAPDATGVPIEREAVIAELVRTGKLWVASERGSADGRFPEGKPAFVLGPGSALVRALELCGPRALAELGGATAPESEPGSERTIEPEPAFLEVASEPETAVVPARASARGLYARLRAVLGFEPAGEREPDPLAEALLAALWALELDGDPVLMVERRRTRRAFGYQAGARRLWFGTGDPRIARIASRAPRDRDALDVLVAAAVAEINRALAEVTDAEERRVLIALASRP